MIDDVDARFRVVSALILSIFLAFCMSSVAGAVGVLVALGLCRAANATWDELGQRILPFVAIWVGLMAFLPFSIPGEALFSVGGLDYSVAGIWRGLSIGLKGLALVLLLSGLLGGMKAEELGQALEGLHAPRKLVMLLLFTARYIHVLAEELHRLRTAMKVRAFRPKLDWHTYRSYGYLAAMILVRSLDRSDRVLAAMRCRGFTGDFHSLRAGRAGRTEWLLLAGSLVMGILLIGLEWMWPRT